MVKENLSDGVYKETWKKLTGPAAGSLGELFFGSRAVVWPDVETEGRGGDDVTSPGKAQAGREYSVKVGVCNTPTPGGAWRADLETVTPTKIIITGTDGAQKCIKVLRAYRIVLLGPAGAAKRNLGNRIFGENVFRLSGGRKSQVRSKSVRERRITVVDAPDFSDTNRPEEEILRCTTGCSPGPHAFLIVLNLGESSKKQQSFIENMSQYFPEEAFRYAAVVLHRDGQLPDPEQCVDQNKSLRDLIEKCSDRYHFVDHGEGEDNKSQMSQLLNTVDKLVIENKGGCYRNKMPQEPKRERGQETPAGNLPHKEKTSQSTWMNFSGPAGTSVTEALFNLSVEDWQETEGSSEESDCDENPPTNNREEEAEAPSQGEEETVSKTVTAERQTSAKPRAEKHIQEEEASALDEEDHEGGATTTDGRGNKEAAGVGGADSVDRPTGLLGLMEQNLGVVLLVAAFYLLLVFSFNSGTFLQSCAVLLIFLSTLFLLAVVGQ